jgi:hypothetical protein
VSTTRQADSASERDETDAKATGDRRWRLRDERDFLVRSLADLRAEREVGDIASRDFEALAARDEARLAAVDSELAELDHLAVPAAEPTVEQAAAPRRRRRRWLVAVAVVALSAGTTLLVVRLAVPRLPGQPATGSVSQNLAQRVQTQLAEAAILVEDGTKTTLGQALTLYRQVLSEDANQPQALAETGWIEWQVGRSASDASLESKGKTLVTRSIKVESDDYAAHLYLGTIDLTEGANAAAVVQYKAFLADHPPASEIKSAASNIEQAFSAVGQPAPSVVSAG